MQYVPLTLTSHVPAGDERTAVFARLYAQTMGARQRRTARRAVRRSAPLARRAAHA